MKTKSLLAFFYLLSLVSSSNAAPLTTSLTRLDSDQTPNGGAKEPCLGVLKVEDMKKIQKRVKMDYQLALDLYDIGIADMMYLAGLITDDAKMTKKDLQKWVKAPTPTGLPTTWSRGWRPEVSMAGRWH